VLFVPTVGKGYITRANFHTTILKTLSLAVLHQDMALVSQSCKLAAIYPCHTVCRIENPTASPRSSLLRIPPAKHPLKYTYQHSIHAVARCTAIGGTRVRCWQTC
jgi:hypothetical protein